MCLSITVPVRVPVHHMQTQQRNIHHQHTKISEYLLRYFNLVSIIAIAQYKIDNMAHEIIESKYEVTRAIPNSCLVLCLFSLNAEVYRTLFRDGSTLMWNWSVIEIILTRIWLEILSLSSILNKTKARFIITLWYDVVYSLVHTFVNGLMTTPLIIGIKFLVLMGFSGV